MEIEYFDRYSANICQENVYGKKSLEWIYSNALGKLILSILIKSWPSRWYGKYQSSKWSRGKILPFIDKFKVNIDEYIPENVNDPDTPYRSFNSFFIRRFKDGVRPVEQQDSKMPAFSEARYFAYESLTDEEAVPVKGKFLAPNMLLGDERWNKIFKGGPMLLARLCPLDYHRFHFPDDGKLIDYYQIPGELHSVNPFALMKNSEIFCRNERHVSILSTKNFGIIAYVEVGAMMVGKIVQTFGPRVFKRGDEKGYFLFGGSTVIVMGQKGVWKPSDDLIHNTKAARETFVKLGDTVANKVNQ
jgi:phosphatidylserine decarboxylase